jgi:hypothetical protein
MLCVFLFFICWSIYNLYTIEGFQSPSGTPSGVPDQSKCEILILSYKSLLERYNKALETNNQAIINSISQGVNTMKAALTSMNCTIPPSA